MLQISHVTTLSVRKCAWTKPCIFGQIINLLPVIDLKTTFSKQATDVLLNSIIKDPKKVKQVIFDTILWIDDKIYKRKQRKQKYTK